MIKGEVVSVGLIRPLASCRDTNHKQSEGWSVQFKYPCPCGSVHDSQALNVWPKGDLSTHTIKLVCPTTNEYIEIELTKPA